MTVDIFSPAPPLRLKVVIGKIVEKHTPGPPWHKASDPLMQAVLIKPHSDYNDKDVLTADGEQRRAAGAAGAAGCLQCVRMGDRGAVNVLCGVYEDAEQTQLIRRVQQAVTV